MLHRVLLLYSPDHSGHRMAATALEEAFRRRYPGVQVRGMNLVKYTNPLLGAAATATYLGVIQSHPSVWRRLYDNRIFKEKTERLRDIVYLSGFRHLRRIMEQEEPDVVVCTQAFPCIIVDKYKHLTGKPLRLVAVVTDFFANLYWMLPGVDLFCVAAEETRADLLQMGGDSERVAVTGIPVRSGFAEAAEQIRNPKSETRNPRSVLVMGGVRGLGPIVSVVERLCALCPDARLVTVAGRNQRLLKTLERVQRMYPDRLTVLTYVNNVHELMSQADVLISKAGGITTSEALAVGLPMVLVSPIPGHEMRNAALLVQKGVAVPAKGAEAAATIASRLLAQPAELGGMRQRMSSLSRPDSSSRIVEKIVSLWGR
jgi:processive 1,2-diacylglycerol beta-glucosyltransferase